MRSSTRTVIVVTAGFVLMAVAFNVLAWGPALWVALFVIGALISLGFAMTPRFRRRP